MFVLIFLAHLIGVVTVVSVIIFIMPRFIIWKGMSWDRLTDESNFSMVVEAS